MLLFKKSSRNLKTVPTSKSDSHTVTIEEERHRVLPNQSLQSKNYALGTRLPEEPQVPLSEEKTSNKECKSATSNSTNEKKLKNKIEELEKRYEKLTASMAEKAEECVKLHSVIKEQEKQIKSLKQENERLKRVCFSLPFIL
jgi:peptidoglycan hydrolase CwlO-like protein